MHERFVNDRISMFLPELKHWYALIGQAQLLCGRVINPELEQYLAVLLARMAGALLNPAADAADNVADGDDPEQFSDGLRRAAEQCLLVAGMFPEQARRTGLDLGYFIDKGRAAYAELTAICPESVAYRGMDRHFLEVVEILQRVHELCGLPCGLDLLQAWDLWEQSGSRFCLRLIKSRTKALPSRTSGTCH